MLNKKDCFCNKHCGVNIDMACILPSFFCSSHMVLEQISWCDYTVFSDDCTVRVSSISTLDSSLQFLAFGFVLFRDYSSLCNLLFCLPLFILFLDYGY